MRHRLCAWAVLPLILLAGCQRTQPVVQAKTTATAVPAHSENAVKLIRATGTVQAVRAFSVLIPQIAGQNGRVTLIKLIPNGARVKEGDVLAEFDRTPQEDAARDAKAKYEDLAHQVRQKAAQNRADAEKRSSELEQAQADMSKALIQLKKGPILSEIDRLKNEAKADSARARVESLRKSDASHDIAEAAALKILELQMDRQKVALERAMSNADKLVLKAQISGMVAHENLWRSGSMGPAQEGDQLWPGQALLKIFDPSEMEVAALIGEPDGAALEVGTEARVFLDAYPDMTLKAHFQSASPVATSALGSPIKNFAARFRLEQNDPRLLPDLSAAVVIEKGMAR